MRTMADESSPTPGAAKPPHQPASVSANRVAMIISAAEETAARLREEGEAKLRERIAEADRAAGFRVAAAEEEAGDIIGEARRLAERIVADARAEAARMRTAATAGAADIRAAAEHEAREIRVEAERWAAEKQAEGERRARELQEEVERLEELRRSLRAEIVPYVRGGAIVPVRAAPPRHRIPVERPPSTGDGDDGDAPLNEG